MPYLLLGKSERVDTRRMGDQPLRKTYKLSCLQTLAPGANWGPDTTELYLNEGMMSVAMTVRDDRWWGVTCLNDEFLHKKSRLEAEGDDEEDTDDEDEEDNDGDVPEINIGQQRRATERSGLRPVELDQVDPILDQGGGYTDRNPRVYMLIVLDTQLSIFVGHHEMLYRALRTAVKFYDESSLPRADESRHSAKDLPGDQIKEALDTVSKFLSKLFEVVKQQEDEVNRFMKKDLGLDPTAKTTTFKDPFFVGLNKLSDPSAKDSAMRIMQLVGKLHKLRHGIEDLQATTTKLRETVNRNIFEDLQIAQHTYASRGVKLGILHYVSQALTIPLNLYSIPHTVTKLPNNNAGLVGVILGSTAAFMIAPLILSFLFEQLTRLRNYLFWRYTELRRDQSTKLRRE